MGAAVFESPPLLLGVTPEDQALAQQLHRVGPPGVEVLHKSQGVPLPSPVKGLLLRSLQVVAENVICMDARCSLKPC